MPYVFSQEIQAKLRKQLCNKQNKVFQKPHWIDLQRPLECRRQKQISNDLEERVLSEKAREWITLQELLLGKQEEKRSIKEATGS